MEKTDHLIWSNYDLDYEDWRADLESEYPEMTENERVALMYDINGNYLDDERINLNIQLSRPILIIGDLGLWNGRFSGYKEIESGNIRDCLYSDTDYSTWLNNQMPPFQRIADAVKTTGLSGYFLRKGCKDGSVPHIKSGTKYLINIPALLRKFGAEQGDDSQSERTK